MLSGNKHKLREYFYASGETAVHSNEWLYTSCTRVYVVLAKTKRTGINPKGYIHGFACMHRPDIYLHTATVQLFITMGDCTLQLLLQGVKTTDNLFI